MRAILLASATAATLAGRRSSKRQPWTMRGSVRLGVSDHGQGSDGQQRAQVAVPMLGDAAEPFLAAARVLLRDQADPGSQIPARLEGLRIGDAGDQRGRD